jgi:hypothetical protein
MEAPLSEAGDVPASIKADAEWYAKNHRRHVDAQARLRVYHMTHGPIRLDDGTACGLFSDGNEWDHRGIANDFPALVQRKAITIKGTVTQFDRAVSLLAEEIPDLEMFDDKYDIDRDAANGVLKAGGEAAATLRQHIHAKSGRLAVR